MSAETPPDPDTGPDDPDERGGEAEVDDQPLGVPDELDEPEAPLPGVPEKEPPSSG
jgi:hypothetical protein